jgi:hypothetical protein
MAKFRTVKSEEKKSFGSLEEARQARPADRPDWKLFQVSDASGGMRWIWSPDPQKAMFWLLTGVEKSHAVIAMDKLPSKTSVAAQLAALSPEDRAEVLREYASSSNKKR